MLLARGVTNLVDVRARPFSARHPHFDAPRLRAALEAAGIVYHEAGRQLGGMRAARADSRHVALREAGLRAYAEHMDSETFELGAAHLMRLATRGVTAVMCAERSPEHCHRSLLSDFLNLRGVRVVHLLAPGEEREHALRPEARRECAKLIYDRHTTGELDLQ